MQHLLGGDFSTDNNFIGFFICHYVVKIGFLFGNSLDPLTTKSGQSSYQK